MARAAIPSTLELLLHLGHLLPRSLLILRMAVETDPFVVFGYGSLIFKVAYKQFKP